MQPWVLEQDPYLCALHATFGDAICIWTAITLLLQEGRIEAQASEANLLVSRVIEGKCCGKLLLHAGLVLIGALHGALHLGHLSFVHLTA